MALSSVTGSTAAILPAREIGALPFEAGEGNQNSQPINDTSNTQRIVPALTEEVHLGNMVDLHA